ncbi:hypothetical protein C4J85_2440 [Pseudomonas sp. R4-34-07]|nr:hypothetical protein C4J85_2440 [Pseudomonas sp. R4-34-07]
MQPLSNRIDPLIKAALRRQRSQAADHPLAREIAVPVPAHAVRHGPTASLRAIEQGILIARP